jgi:hypothetical protein
MEKNILKFGAAIILGSNLVETHVCSEASRHVCENLRYYFVVARAVSGDDSVKACDNRYFI